MELPPGTVDPIYQCQLAERLHMTVGELTHGRGTPMSAHELGVLWPLYDMTVARIQKREHDRQEREASKQSRGRRR